MGRECLGDSFDRTGEEGFSEHLASELGAGYKSYPSLPTTPAEVVGKGASRCREVEGGGCLARGPGQLSPVSRGDAVKKRSLALGNRGSLSLKVGKGFGI